MQDEGVPPTLTICNSLMEAYLRVRNTPGLTEGVIESCSGRGWQTRRVRETEQIRLIANLVRRFPGTGRGV